MLLVGCPSAGLGVNDLEQDGERPTSLDQWWITRWIRTFSLSTSLFLAVVSLRSLFFTIPLLCSFLCSLFWITTKLSLIFITTHHHQIITSLQPNYFFFFTWLSSLYRSRCCISGFLYLFLFSMCVSSDIKIFFSRFSVNTKSLYASKETAEKLGVLFFAKELRGFSSS